MVALSDQLHQFTLDNRVGSVHLCMYVALLQCKEEQGGSESFFIRRDELMRLARIQGRTTYYRVMKDLNKWRYIRYEPSRDPAGRGRVRMGITV